MSAALAEVPTPTPLLEVEQLRVRYPVRRSLRDVKRHAPSSVEAVRGVSLTLNAGELVALVGESGSGKSTTVMSILGMLPRHAGELRFEGRPIPADGARALKPFRRAIQMVYQDPYESLDPRFKVIQTVEEPLVIHRLGGSRRERRRRALDALAQAGLAPPELYAERYPHQLSGGQRQRVAIAASLVVEPQVLLTDEPVSMLDVSVRAEILKLLAGLRERGLAVLMITHDLATAAHYADRIAVMYFGAIVEEGPTREVIAAPQHPYTRALISVAGSTDPTVRRARTVLHGEVPDLTAPPRGCAFHNRCPIAVERCAEVHPELHRTSGSRSPAHRAACIEPQHDAPSGRNAPTPPPPAALSEPG